MGKEATIGLERMFKEHNQSVFRLLCRLGASPHDAEDIVQETFIAANESLSSFKGESTLRTWIISIAYNKLRNHRRSGAKRYEIEELVETFEDKRLPPDELLVQRETIRRLYRVLKHLPEEICDTFMMATFGGYSDHAELASVLGINPGTVATRINRVREALKVERKAMEGKQ